MKKISNNILKVILLGYCICSLVYLSGCGTNEKNNDHQLLIVPKIDFNYEEIETDYNVSNINKPMMYFNCRFILPINYTYEPESESILRLADKKYNFEQNTGVLWLQLDNLIEIHCNSKGDPLTDETFIKELFEGNTDAAKEYYVNYNNKTLENANKFNSKEKYELLDQNIDIQYYKSEKNHKIAALSSEVTIMIDSNDEPTVIRNLYYYREDLPDTYILTGVNEKIDQAQHYAIHIMNSLQIIDRATI